LAWPDEKDNGNEAIPSELHSAARGGDARSKMKKKPLAEEPLAEEPRPIMEFLSRGVELAKPTE